MAHAGDQQLQHRKEFGERVRQLRKLAGYSQEAFAHAVGLDRTYIGGIERGERNVSIDNIHRIASALHISPTQLFVDPSQ